MMALTESEFSVLNLFYVTKWKNLKRISPFFIRRFEALGFIEIHANNTHARITPAGRAAHRETHILRGKGEASPCLVEELNRFSRMK